MTSRGPLVITGRKVTVENTAPVESFSTFTPLGVQLWDMLSEAPIRRRLDVEARACPGTGRAVRSFMTPAGVHAFRNLPGLRHVEFPDAAASAAPGSFPEASLPESLPSEDDPAVFVLSVRDPRREFSPATLVVPAPHRGLVRTSALMGDCAASPPESLPVESLPDPSPPIYLTSAPTRSLPPGAAAVRAQLRTTSDEIPEHAVLDIEIGLPDGSTTSAAGVSDETGAVLVPFPLPAFAVTTGPSPPPGTAGSPLADQCWPVAARVLYEPGALTRIADIPTPTLTSIFGQAPVPIWEDLTVSTPSLATQLCFGSELVLKTSDHDRPDLLIGASPP